MWEAVETPSPEAFKKELFSYVSGQTRWMEDLQGLEDLLGSLWPPLSRVNSQAKLL